MVAFLLFCLWSVCSGLLKTANHSKLTSEWLKKEEIQCKTGKNEFSTSETMQKDSSVRGVKFIPLSYHSSPRRKESQDWLER